MGYSVDVDASDWNNRIRGCVIKITSKIPEVGTVVSVLVDFLWPTDKVNIFQALKADITKLVNKKILEYELNLHKSELDALKVIIDRYKAAQPHEKGNFLSNWITEADKLSVIFRQSNNNIHLILLVISLALLHLTALRERLLFGKTLYGEDNTPQWKKDLEDMYKLYIVDFLPTIYKKWKVWRAEQVEIKSWVKSRPPYFILFDTYATVEDTVTGDKREFHCDGNVPKHYEAICQDFKTQMCNDANADMAGCISATFVYDKLLPNNTTKFPKYDKEVFGRMFRGPYAQDLCYKTYGEGSFRTRPNEDDYYSNSGPITKVIVREWNTIDAMQFIYANREGRLAGDARGGLRHDVDVRGKEIYGLRMGFSNGVLTYVQIMYCDGSSSETFGNRSGWRCYEVLAKAPAGYKVSSWSFQAGAGPSHTRAPVVIQLEYTPLLE